MNEVRASIGDPYRVRAGDTLSSIAKRCGQRVQDLQRWNGIKNADQLQVGQVLYLSEGSAFGISFTFLDGLRHPIANLSYRLAFDGRTVTGRTGGTGVIEKKVTRSADSVVDVWIQDAEMQWRKLASTSSGYGHKLVTLVSDSLVIPAKLDLFPESFSLDAVWKQIQTATHKAQAKIVNAASGSPTKNNPSVTAKHVKGPKGQPVVVIGVKIPQDLLEFFSKFNGGEIEDRDWRATAEGLDCDLNVLKAFSEVESGGRNSFWRLNNGQGAHIPAILFERHYFSKLTKHVHDKDYPDISWPTGYRKAKQLGKADKKMHDGQVDVDDIYADYASAYLRLIKAYQLDKDAALRACSWGKFQIMGANFGLCGADNVEKFVERMCLSEHAQIGLMAEFIRNKPRSWKDPRHKNLGLEISLWDAVKTKNWRAIAFNYNGPDYAVFDYHKKLEKAYEKYSKI